MKDDGRCVVELRTDRRLLCPDFEGYRLAATGCGDTPKRHRLPATAIRSELGSHHKSLLHARLYGLHNALVFDRFSSACDTYSYFICNKGQIWRIGNDVDGDVRFVPLLDNPLQIPQDSPTEGAHPPRLIFYETEKALATDGRDLIFLFSTGKRNFEDAPLWKQDAAVRVPFSETGFTIFDAKSDDANDVHCALYRIQPEGNLCIALLDWVILKFIENDVKFEPYREFKVRGVVHYCVLERGCESLYVAADRPVEFLNKPAEEVPLSSTNVEKKILYSWMQNADEVTVTLQLKADHRRSPPNVETFRNSIDINYEAKSRVKGEPFGAIDHELTTWSVDESNKLNVLLLKREPGVYWPSLLKNGDPNGEQIMDPSYVAEVHARLAHLCSEVETTDNDAPLFNSQQLEECDFVSEEESCLMRLEAKNYRITHQAFLSAHQIILNVHLNSSEVTALGLREDADTCIWQPYKCDGNIWPVKHEGTLLAFGYIQSSKQQKKYTVCSPNLKYSVVCEANRHAFIYRQEWSSNRTVQLRHRNTSGDSKKVNIGKQQIVSFERDEEILGICATNDALYILTEHSLISFNMRN